MRRRLENLSVQTAAPNLGLLRSLSAMRRYDVSNRLLGVDLGRPARLSGSFWSNYVRNPAGLLDCT